MFFQTAESATGYQLPLQQQQFHWQDQAVQEASQMAHSYQQQSHVQQQQQNQVHPFHPHHSPILLPQGHEYDNLHLHPQNQDESPKDVELPTFSETRDANLATAVDESLELEQLEQFANTFRRKRIQFGFTQTDAGLAMGKLYANDFSQTTVSRFEALNLSYKNMCKLKPFMQKWVAETDISLNNPSSISNPPTPPKPIGTRRKKRTCIEGALLVALVTAFGRNPKPTTTEVAVIAEDLGIGREVVRVWFRNRRQKEKRISPPSTHPPMHQPDMFANRINPYSANHHVIISE